MTRLVCDWGGRPIALKARQFVLAAGAFLTPALLQRSASVRHPDGLANSSGLVGRNLMMHASSHVFLRLKAGPSTRPAMGYGAVPERLLHPRRREDGQFPRPSGALRRKSRSTSRLNRSGGSASSRGRCGSGSRRWRPGSTAPGRRSRRSSRICRITEITWPRSRARTRAWYTLTATPRSFGAARRRWSICSGRRRATLRHVPFRPIGGLNCGHGCGTCRFGEDPRTSVLDRDNRAHDLDNLYVVDASFFPSSAGINPSLTIIANSLRASDRIAERL